MFESSLGDSDSENPWLRMILQKLNLITTHACLAVLQDVGQGPLQIRTAMIPMVHYSPALPASLLLLPQILLGPFTLAGVLTPLSRMFLHLILAGWILPLQISAARGSPPPPRPN